MIGARGQWRCFAASDLIHMYRLLDVFFRFSQLTQLGMELRARDTRLRLQRSRGAVRTLLVELVCLLDHWQGLAMLAQSVAHQAQAQKHPAAVAAIQAVLLLDELQRLPEVVLRFVVIAEGVVCVRDVFAQRGPLSEDVLHLVKQRQRFPELGLLPEYKRQRLDGLELVLVGPLPASRHHFLQVVVQLVQAVELDAIVKQREECLEGALVLEALLLK
mmetsp:Transcript_132951/g.384385  ORF Transcript_132951/g.384385 Transcript_132951/m.384385 type:complete len:217 (-) Transcript_132951:487-1137(-)